MSTCQWPAHRGRRLLPYPVRILRLQVCRTIDASDRLAGTRNLLKPIFVFLPLPTTLMVHTGRVNDVIIMVEARRTRRHHIFGFPPQMGDRGKGAGHGLMLSASRGWCQAYYELPRSISRARYWCRCRANDRVDWRLSILPRSSTHMATCRGASPRPSHEVP